MSYKATSIAINSLDDGLNNPVGIRNSTDRSVMNIKSLGNLLLTTSAYSVGLHDGGIPVRDGHKR